MKTIIIGKNSNLSSFLSKELDNTICLSSRDLLSNISVLATYINHSVNIIFNNFQPATKLSDISNTEDYIINSIGITSKVLDFCKTNSMKINKIIYTSSSSVYGNNILCNEKDELKPMNLHASLKLANEKLIEKFCFDNNIDYTITRVFNMYGGNDNFSVISKIINAYKLNDNLTIVNNGNAIRDFIHIDDVVEIYMKLLKVKDIKIINVGTGKGSSIKNIIDSLYNHNKKLKTSNIFRDELKISTSDNRVLLNKLKKENFIKVEHYVQKELNI